MDTSSSISPYFLAYKAAQVKLGDKSFLSRDITVRDLLLNRTDVYHVMAGRGCGQGANALRCRVVRGAQVWRSLTPPAQNW